MRTILIGLAGLALVSMTACGPGGSAASSGASPAATAQSGPISLSDLPHLSPGLWKQTMSTDRAQEPLPVTEICVDAAYSAKMSAFGSSVNKNNCSSQSFTRNLDGSITFSSTCSIGQGGQVSSHGTMTGSFASGYSITMDSTTTNMTPASANGEQKMTITGVLEGPCPASERAGDTTVTLPNGTKTTMNMGNLSQ